MYDEDHIFTGDPTLPGLLEAIREAGINTDNRDGTVYVSDPEAATAIASTFDSAGWVLALRKDAATDRVRALFDASDKSGSKIDAGFSYGGKLFQINASALQNINGAVTAAMLSAQMSLPYSQSWIAADNTATVFDGPGMITFGMAVAAYISALTLNAHALKAQIAALMTSEACDAFDVTTGWPG